MTTKWKGQYTYGESYPETIRGTSIPFYLEWTEEDGMIKGTCVDEESEHVFDQPATLTGFIENDFASFILMYPHFLDRDAEQNIRLFKDQPSQEIHYTGTLIEDIFQGNWEMIITYIDDLGKVTEHYCVGIWTMKKEQ